MTRDEFIEKATRVAEYALQIPAGWWGVYRDVTNGIARVRFSRDCWVVSLDGKVVSRHDSRSFAIGKAAKL